MPNIFTKTGLAFLETLLQRKRELIRQLGQEVGEAAGPNCDWHDNFAFEDARRRLEMETGMLQQLISDLDQPRVIVPEEQQQRVAIGTTLEVRFDGEVKEFTIGAFGEINPTLGLISYSSPLGKSLVGMQVGDEKRVVVGGRPVDVEVLKIYPPSYRYGELIAGVFPKSMDDADE